MVVSRSPSFLLEEFCHGIQSSGEVEQMTSEKVNYAKEALQICGGGWFFHVLNGCFYGGICANAIFADDIPKEISFLLLQLTLLFVEFDCCIVQLVKVSKRCFSWSSSRLETRMFSLKQMTLDLSCRMDSIVR